MSCRSTICILASLCLALELRPLRGQANIYSRLCAESLSTKPASRLRLILCQNMENNIEVVRRRRDVNTTQQTNQSNTPITMPMTTTKRPYYSYECKPHLQQTSPNGFSPNGKGLNLTAEFVKETKMCSAIISWETPKTKPGSADCVGYVVVWQTPLDHFSGRYCHYITNKNKTTFFMDESKGWAGDHDADDRLFISVYALPPTNVYPDISYRKFQPPRCSGETPSSPSSTTSMSSTKKVINTSTGSVESGGDNYPSKRPVVNKLVFSIVITCLAVVIFAILVAIYRRRKKHQGEDINQGTENKALQQGARHYISYNAEDKNVALDIVKWLQEKGVNVVIDLYSYIKSNRRAWSEKQLQEAERIIMIITPKYLAVCNVHQAKSYKQKNFSSFNNECVYNEILWIQNKLLEMNSEKLIAVLVDVKKNDLPPWMSQMNCYKYKDGKMNDDILSILKSCHDWNII